MFELRDAIEQYCNPPPLARSATVCKVRAVGHLAVREWSNLPPHKWMIQLVW